MRVAVNSHALPIYKKNRIASLLCIFETTILQYLMHSFEMGSFFLLSSESTLSKLYSINEGLDGVSVCVCVCGGGGVRYSFFIKTLAHY